MEGKTIAGIVLGIMAAVLLASIISTTITLFVLGGIIDSEVASLQSQASGLDINCNKIPNDEAIKITIEELTLYCKVS